MVTGPVPQLRDETVAALTASADRLSSTAIARIDAGHEWYGRLAAQDRSWVGLVAQAGIRAFLGWLTGSQPDSVVTAAVFGAAPRELTRSINLAETLDLVRTVVDTVETETAALAGSADAAVLREAVLRYSREVAFAAAQVYAEAAEARGAWDARLESLVVDAVMRGEADDSVRSRVAALGWGSIRGVTVVVGHTPRRDASAEVEELRRTAGRLGVEVLASIQGRRLIVIVGGTGDIRPVATELAPHFGDGPVVHGPTVPHLFAAGRSARAALSGLTAAPARPTVQRPCSADELLAERVLAGDDHARRALVSGIYAPLEAAGGHLIDTLDAYLEQARLEAAARALYVHPNTVRYRLSRIAELTGYDALAPRDAQVLRIALAVGRLRAQPRATWRPLP